MTPAQTILREAAADLDALRAQAGAAQGSQIGIASDTASQPIIDAWTIARTRFIKACERYAQEMK